MDSNNNAAMERLEGLQRDLIAFSENRLPTLDRLSSELEASIEDLRRFLDRKKRSDESRKVVNPTAAPKTDVLKIEDAEYRVTEDFRQSVLQVSDELDLDEIEAARLCVDVEADAEGEVDSQLAYKALLRYHNHRYLVLDCMRLLLMQAADVEAELESGEWFLDNVRKVIRGKDGKVEDASAFWMRCISGLTEVEAYLKKIADHQQAAVMTGVAFEGDFADALIAQRMLLVQQHETLGAILSYLIRGRHAVAVDFRSLLSKAASLDADSPMQLVVHYFPALISGSAYFGADDTITLPVAKELHALFADGHGQQQWKHQSLQAAATAWWVAEYSFRFLDPTNTGTLRVADRQKEESERTQLFLKAVGNKAFHLMLLAGSLLKPEVWHDPAKVGLVQFLLEDHASSFNDSIHSTPSFADLVMNEFQAFSDALVSNMPDVLRRMKSEEDDRRRAYFSNPSEETQQVDLHLERFIVIMAYSYQDDPEAAQDFWSDKESNLYGFLRWASQRLPTPRVAAFCELLTSIATTEKLGNQAHRFLLEDTAPASGKFRKTFSVSWAQIFGELDTYANTVRNKPAAPQTAPSADPKTADLTLIEPETYIMLEAYLRLASHVCRLSPDARNWILREQTFHLGEVLFELASSGQQSRVHASCFDLLSALLIDKLSEVNDGMWVLLDNWISGGVPAGGISSRARSSHPGQQYLQAFAANPETATGVVNFLNILISPSQQQDDITLDALPFPENLGSPHRDAGINTYVDFVLGTAFKSTTSNSELNVGERSAEIDVLRCACLQFVIISLSTFNEDLVALANTSAVDVDSAIRTSSLASYVRLHPFTRVMEWLFNSNVSLALALCAIPDVEYLNSLDAESPKVQAALRSVAVMNLAMRMQATYFDIVRPLINAQSTRRPAVANAPYSSYDEVLLANLDVVTNIASLSATNHAELSLESLSLLKRVCMSKKLGGRSHFSGDGGRQLMGNRLVGRLSERSEVLSAHLCQYFQVYDWDLENEEQPLKLVKAQVLVEVLNSSLDASAGRAAVAHCLLGFDCRDQTVTAAPGGQFSRGQSLFHTMVSYAAVSPYAIEDSNVSWLLSVKRGCLDIILKLAISPLTRAIVLPELRAMDFLGAASQNQLPAAASPMWDKRSLSDPELLLGSSGSAVSHFLHVRRAYFEYAALALRTANEQHAYSIQEKIVAVLFGTIRFPNGQESATNSIFDLSDFFDLVTDSPSEASCKYLGDLNLSICLKDDPYTFTAFDIPMINQLLALRKSELVVNGTIKEASEEQQVDDEMRAILASVLSQNNWQVIKAARLSTLEAWTDLLSLLITAGGLSKSALANFAYQGLQVVLPRFDRALLEDMESAALLAKLTLSLVPTITAASGESGQDRAASSASERLLSAFRICLKAITDSDTDLALRDVCYRTCGEIFSALTLIVVNGKTAPSANAKQLLQLVQSAGDRLITVVTEDAFSGRGITRVSSLLFLDALVGLFQLVKVMPAMLRALAKLNFVPVLIDQSIGSVASSFDGNNDDLATPIAYFHTSLSLLLRICRTVDGAQLVLTSGFFPAVADSRLFSTDPDIGLDIDNPAALREFYKLMSSVLRVITAMVITQGPTHSTTLREARTFLQQNRFSMQAVFKRTSAVQKTAGPPEVEARQVAEEYGKLLLVTDFLEEDEPAQMRTSRMNGFT